MRHLKTNAKAAQAQPHSDPADDRLWLASERESGFQ